MDKRKGEKVLQSLDLNHETCNEKFCVNIRTLSRFQLRTSDSVLIKDGIIIGYRMR